MLRHARKTTSLLSKLLLFNMNRILQKEKEPENTFWLAALHRYGLCHLLKIYFSVLNLAVDEFWDFSWDRLRSSTKVLSCFYYALRVLCAALKKGWAGGEAEAFTDRPIRAQTSFTLHINHRYLFLGRDYNSWYLHVTMGLRTCLGVKWQPQENFKCTRSLL